MKEWLSGHGLETESLDKKAVVELLKDCPEDLREVLTIRKQLAKSSVRKYTAMETRSVPTAGSVECSSSTEQTEPDVSPADLFSCRIFRRTT
jgi:hypothetical protein